MGTQKVNFRFIINIFGIILFIESLFIVLDLIVSFFYDTKNILPVSESLSITLLTSLVLYFSTYKNNHKRINKRETYLIITLSWVLISLFGTLPYLLTHSIPNFVDALFESTSGFTTTGASIVNNIEQLPKSILFWRSETHWIGGIGIIVLFITLFHFLKKDSIYLFNSEFSNVTKEKIFPKIVQITKSLILVYLTLTFVEVFLLTLGGMSLFDSVCHSFATIATGGFSTKNDSIKSFTPYIQYIIIVFMLLSGINFNLYILGMTRRFKNIFQNEELRLFITIIFLVGFALTFILYLKLNVPFEESFRTSFFHVVSIITATGFATTDYLQWPEYAWFLIVLLMFIGASSSSTGGGIKVIRHLIAFKYIQRIFKKLMHPKIVYPIKYNGRVLSDRLLQQVLTFIVFYLFIVAGSSLILVTLNIDPITSFGSVLTCIGGIGPGLGVTGPASNFAVLPSFAKIFLSFIMIIGRLEIFSVLTIFTYSFWNY